MGVRSALGCWLRGLPTTVVTTALVGASLLASREAQAVRWGLGVASEITPLVDDNRGSEEGYESVTLGFRPVIELEANYWLAFQAYAPFTVYRADSSDSAASSGAESVFALGATGRLPFFRDTAPEEILVYATARGGFGTVSGRAGPFLGGALGTSFTWLETGRGLFAEVALSRLSVGTPEPAALASVSRTALSFSIGLIFRLGGEDWPLGRSD